MANTKISALTSATTPLAGTEVLPIVQSGSTVKVASNDLTVRNVRANATTGILQVTGPTAASTRVMTVPDANFTAARTDAAQSFTGDQTLSTGNLVIGTNGKGIDFSATPGTGTSELLADYEEGTWTPVPTASAGAITTYTSAGSYVKVGKLVTCIALIDITNFGTASGDLIVSGLPFTSQNTTDYAPVFIRETFATGVACTGRLVFNTTQVTRIYKYDGTSVINVLYPREIFLLNISYISA
jgi:hypothetical protein